MRERLQKIRALPLWALAATMVTVPLLAIFGLPVGANDEPPTLTTVSGTLAPCGGDYCVGDTVADFGPWWYLESTESEVDLDGDGTSETLAQELDGLVGRDVTLEVELGPRDADVHVVNGLAWREHTDGPPPWAGGPFRTAGTREGNTGVDVGNDTAAQQTTTTQDPPPSSPPTPPTAPPTGGGDEGPSVLTPISGTLVRCGDDYCIGETVVDFGPWWYHDSTQSSHDFDGGGTSATLAQELNGLAGQQVTLEVESGPRDADVYVVNGIRWRETTDEPPPWAGGPMRQGRATGETGPPEGQPRG